MRSAKFLCLLLLVALMVGCMPPKQGSLERGFTIWGYVGNTSTEPAANVMVILVDGNSGQPISSKNSNILGKYNFAGIMPGYYKIRVGDKEMEVVISTENQRIDIDLSSKTGAMNYATAAKKGTAGNGKPGGDPGLVENFAGKWYSFSGAAGGGGSESQIAFCSNGSYYDSYDASYSGASSDQYGNETMNWGQASQSGGSGSWSVEGTVQSGEITVTYSNSSSTVIRYEQSNDDPRCYYFDGRLHCYNGACQ